MFENCLVCEVPVVVPTSPKEVPSLCWDCFQEMFPDYENLWQDEGGEG